MILVINTADLEKVFIGLIKNNKLIDRVVLSAKFRQSEKLLPAIDRIMKRLGLKIGNLKAIVVVDGPGPFTALRVGISVGNTLAWALNIPVFGIHKDEFVNQKDLISLVKVKAKKGTKGLVTPFYNQEPNITKKKSLL
jgi:tRNA threonylcarbamoyl adenosine modification protein YeaZ